MPVVPVHHQLLKIAQTHVHQVGDAIQLSHPLLSPSLPALNLLADPACKKGNKGMEGERLCSQSWSLEVELTCSVWSRAMVKGRL